MENRKQREERRGKDKGERREGKKPNIKQTGKSIKIRVMNV